MYVEFCIRHDLRFILAAVACLCLSLPGCGGKQGAKNLTVDQSLARQSLTTALDAWKAGEKPAALKDRMPPIIVSDGTWESGVKLTDYKSVSERDLGANLQITVQLTLDEGGAPSTRQAVYTVSTSPAITVVTEFME